MNFPGFQWVPLVADLLLLGFVTVGCVLAVFAARRPFYRDAWASICCRQLPMASAGLLALFLAVALVDSVHFSQRLEQDGVPATDAAGTPLYSPQVLSLLDWVCTGLRERQEKTFSAPFATHQFTRELLAGEDGSIRQRYPRLLHGGAHLGDPGQRGADLWRQARWGLVAGLVLGGLVAAGVQRWFRRAGGTEGLGLALFGGVVVLLIAVVVDLSGSYHVLGTDQVGQDVFYRALKGCRVGLILGTVTTLIATPLAIILGIAAGLLGGWVDDVIQYIYATLSSIPDILLIAAVMLIVQTLTAEAATIDAADARLVWLCVVMGVGSWTGLCRLIRGETLKIRAGDYVTAAYSLGVSPLGVMARHVLPNITHLVLISMLLRFSGLVLAEAVLAYVGIGAHPSTESWGSMINGARLDVSRDPIVWWNLAAALLFMVGLILPANLFGEAVRDALDPRAKVVSAS